MFVKKDFIWEDNKRNGIDKINGVFRVIQFRVFYRVTTEDALSNSNF